MSLLSDGDKGNPITRGVGRCATCAPACDDHTLLRFGGRQPLWGIGVWSSTAVMFKPLFCNAVMADSRPGPGPFTRTSISRMPRRLALVAHFSAARVAAKGVLLRAPLKPTVPAESQHSVSPFMSVMVI